ncbi:MAG: hypothetical protein K8S98_18765 [Planctomycetes bacterium]|nr:hypothetical protein [Planctomycetota bacterium]
MNTRIASTSTSRSVRRLASLGIVSLCAALSARCAVAQSPSSTATHVPGPEATDLVARTHGTIAIDHPHGGIETIELPTQVARLPRAPGPEQLTAHSLAGPDAHGRIAFVANDMTAERHELDLLEVDGRTTRLFAAEGDALWSRVAGRNLALSNDGRRVALVRAADGVTFRSPDAYVIEGELGIWDTATHTELMMRSRVLDDTLSWFPDGRRLAFTALVPRAEAEALLATEVEPSDAFGRATLAWKRVAVVHVLDVESGQATPLHVGERPIVSTDGRTLVLHDFEQRWRVVDIESRHSRPFTAPGAVAPGAIAFVDAHTVLYWALPTEGLALKYTESNSPLVGKKTMRTLKLVDLRDGRFQTVVPYIDPRRSVSFGGASGPLH